MIKIGLAVNNEGVITFYNSLPNKLRTSTGLHLNLKDWTPKQYKENGLFDVMVDSDYDERIHNLGEVYWVAESKIFKKDKTNKTWSQSLSELKEQAINNFKSRIGSELAKTDWYIIRNVDNGAEIPSEIQEARQDLRNTSDTVEQEINAITKKADVITYDFPNID
tara:strand:- start:54 stop:548 length:495 start_codon:yes stop_codon:yes gene_type:complete